MAHFSIHLTIKQALNFYSIFIYSTYVSCPFPLICLVFTFFVKIGSGNSGNIVFLLNVAFTNPVFDWLFSQLFPD